MPFNSPFTTTKSEAGKGIIKLSILPPAKPVLEVLSYQYPLKLIAPVIARVNSGDASGHGETLVHTVFLLTYGGGLVAGDSVNLYVELARTTRLVLLTQGSTKIFRSPTPDVITRQSTLVGVAEGASICYLPDPVQPFAASVFEQRQTYHLKGRTANICVCDWVTEGRAARGEKWSFDRYVSRNEFWLIDEEARRLLVRDNVILDSSASGSGPLASRMDKIGVFGTLTLHGPLFRNLGIYLLDEFRTLPRIGSRQWDAEDDKAARSPAQQLRAARVAHEVRDGVLWTVAETRGFVVVKFGAREVEGAKRWIKAILSAEGTVEREFGERALLCMR